VLLWKPIAGFSPHQQAPAMKARNIIQIVLFLGIAEALALGAGSVLLSRPAAAQFWGDPFSRPRPPRAIPDQPFNPFGGIFQQPMSQPPAAPRRPHVARPPRAQLGDFSNAPPPRKPETPATTHIVVMGDSLADWLGHGLEEAFADNAEFGVVRKFRANIGLIRNESRSDSYDWVTSAREQLAAEKPDFIVVIIGLSDRVPFRERPGARAAGRQGQQTQQGQSTGSPTSEGQVKLEQPSAEQPSTTTATHEFRSEKWGELYGKRVDDMIATLKGKGVPVLWVGLPPMRGARARTDLAYLNDLYRARAEKAGITFVDVWDGFVDEDGNFSIRGPDYNGQIRQLRSPDGVYFTKAGALKLGHYVEREIQRLVGTRAMPVALPAPEPQQQTPEKPGALPSRPVAGPVILLTGGKTAPEELVGSRPARSDAPDPVVTRVLVRGEAAPSVSGRADDFSWPRAEADDSDIILGTVRPAAPQTVQRPTKKGPMSPTKAAPKRAAQAASTPPASGTTGSTSSRR
jgi:hypothetical protein